MNHHSFVITLSKPKHFQTIIFTHSILSLHLSLSSQLLAPLTFASIPSIATSPPSLHATCPPQSSSRRVSSHLTCLHFPKLVQPSPLVLFTHSRLIFHYFPSPSLPSPLLQFIASLRVPRFFPLFSFTTFLSFTFAFLTCESSLSD